MQATASLIDNTKMILKLYEVGSVHGDSIFKILILGQRHHHFGETSQVQWHFSTSRAKKIFH